jgi:3-hydroxyisobutyrate dehydrogenase-like beta-hydroxyacid dehydrogenase
MKIGFLGLGNMGAAIAANLRKAGHELTVWNRTAAKTTPLVEAGAVRAETPRRAAHGRDVVFSMLADDAALESVLEGDDGLIAGLGRGALHVSLSTIAIATAERCVERHRAADQRFLSAPVFGRPEAAAAAKLFIVAAGERSDFERIEPLLAVIGQRSFYLGAEPPSANLVKLCGNFMILSAIEIMGEAMALAEKGGIARKQLLEVITGTLFDAPVFRTYGTIVAEERFKPAGFAAPLGLKDMRLAGQAAEALRVPMPVLSILRDRLLQLIAQDGEDIDWSAITRSSARNAGL